MGKIQPFLFLGADGRDLQSAIQNLNQQLRTLQEQIQGNYKMQSFQVQPIEATDNVVTMGSKRIVGQMLLVMLVAAEEEIERIPDIVG